MKKKFLSIILCIIVVLLLGASSAYAVNTTNYVGDDQNSISSRNTNSTSKENLSKTVNSENNNSENMNEDQEVNIAATTAENEVNQTTTNTTSEEKQKELSNHDIGLLAAALATGLACIGAGIAVAMVASSAIGAISENPSLLGKTIIFAGLAEGIAIYGLIISIMILNKV